MSTEAITTRPWYSSSASLAKLVAVVYNDACPREADAAYLFGEEPKNEMPVLTRGEEMLKTGAVKQMLFPGSDGNSLNGNHYFWRRWKKFLLEFAALEEELVHGIPISQGTFWHTHIEAGQLIRYASAKGIKTLFVTAATTHQIRAFVEVVWAIKTGCGGILPPQKIKVYSKPPLPPLSWQTPTVIAQTQVGGEKPMIDTIADELERIERYYAKGDLVTCEEVLEYLAWRDDLQQTDTLKFQPLTIGDTGYLLCIACSAVVLKDRETQHRCP